MNIINKQPISEIGYHFIEAPYLPKGKNEYHLRDKQRNSNQDFIQLTNKQIDQLIANNNQSDNWQNILVTKKFNSNLVKNNAF